MSIFERSELLIGKENLNKLSKVKVAVFGVGGVGSYVVEALVRGGVGHIVAFDSDCVAQSNINRQLIATIDTIGLDKVEVAKNRALKINPDIDFCAEKVFISAENIEAVDFSQFDYVVDAIDTVTSKLLLIEKANEKNVPIISCMGTGNKLDPTKFEITDISKTSVCPLARVMRYELKKRGIKKVKVLYSKEEPIKTNLTENGKAVPGSISFVPSVAGLIIAGEVIKDIIA